MRSLLRRLPALLILGWLPCACDRPASPPPPEPPVAEESASPTPELPPPSPSPTPEDPLAVRIGFFVPLSGPQAAFGEDALHGAQLAVEELNAAGGVLNHPIRLIVKDTQSRAEETAVVVAELIRQDHVSALIGEITSDRTLAAAPLAQTANVPLITPGATHENVTAAGDGVFRVCFTDTFQAATMAHFAQSLGAGKAALLFDSSDPYSSGLAEKFRADFLGGAGGVVVEKTYRSGDKDFSQQLTAIRAAAPEVIFLPAYYPDAAAIIRQARELGIEVPFLGTDGWNAPDFLLQAGEAADNCYFSSHFSAENAAGHAAAFAAAFAAKYSTPPQPLAALSYDAVRLVVDSLHRAGSREAATLKPALAATRDFPGVTGTITFDENRNPRKPAQIFRVEEGKFSYLETIEPPPLTATPGSTPTETPVATPGPSPSPSPATSEPGPSPSAAP